MTLWPFTAEYDYRDVYREVVTGLQAGLQARYYQFGIELGLRPAEKLNTIQTSFFLNTHLAFTDVLLVWLRQEYNVEGTVLQHGGD